MSIKSLFNSLSGQTSSSKVEVVERTHFNGKIFKKVITVEETAEVKRKEAKKADAIFPKEAPHKPFSRDYKFSFSLDLAKRPEDNWIRDLINDSQYTNYYKPFLEKYRPQVLTALGLNEDWYCTRFVGFKVSNWLEITASHTFEGKYIEDYPGAMNLFEMKYEEMFVLQTGNEYSPETRDINIEEYQVNKAIQQILLWETNIFSKECFKIMSPG